MKTTLIVNAKIVNEGKVTEGDLLIKGERIEKIGNVQQVTEQHTIIDAKGSYLLPGAIDDQVHFREPGLTHKANIFTESRAAVAGGVTTYMEMPNTSPPTFTQSLLEDKYKIAAHASLANYSFYIGASNENIEEVLKTDLTKVCGLKIFMGSSTGNLLVDNPKTLEAFFSKFQGLIATHCEDEQSIRRNMEAARQKFGEDVPVSYHPIIRDEEVCYLSSSMAVELAKKFGTHLHVLHISTAKELSLFDNSIPLEKKKITAEACIHHLWFNENDYATKGSLIKWNPAVKSASDQQAILQAVLNNTIDVIATDHAPHLLEEKQNPYFKAPSGGPLVQHSVVAMLEMVKQGKITIEKVVEKMSHHVAILYRIQERGFIREGYFADLVLVNPNESWQVEKKNILAKCGWSPFEGQTFSHKVTHTFVSGYLAYANGMLQNEQMGQRLKFSRA
ncbi:MAG: dihydroorotase [Chryseotalea sp.]